jgi:crotonobetainyl-CoA:carnitine CoA-transferase CaiB-like acyl-CoA transferase
MINNHLLFSMEAKEMLEGIKVIELEGLGPAPFACMTLADLGADVITVQNPFKENIEESNVNLLNRGKRSITLNLKDHSDKKKLIKLIKTADVLVEGFRPGVMERLGFSNEEVLAINDRLVYGRMTGWGQNGPNSSEAGHDLNYISRSGALWFASNEGDVPFTPPTLVGDIGGGALYLVIGVLAGILKVKNSGKGTVIDAAIVDGSAHMMNLLMSLIPNSGSSVSRKSSVLDGPHWSRCYRCLDNQFISIQCLEVKFYNIFLEKLNLTKDEEFMQQNNKELWPILTNRLIDLFLSQKQEFWIKLFKGSDACVAPVLSPVDAMADEHMSFRNVWEVTGNICQAKPAPRFSNWKNENYQKIPFRGQHTDEILKESKKLG